MNKLFSYSSKVHDAITSIGYWLGVLALLAILCMFCYEITARYFFRNPTQWISDYTGYALLFSTFLLAPRVTKNRGHIEITFIRDALPPLPQHIFNALLFMLAAGACIWAGWYAVEEAMRQYDRGIRTMAVVSVPRWWMSAAIAYGFINSGLYFIRASIEELRASKVEQVPRAN
ncbi:TRAP transporter small permease [Halomonas sp. AOP27-A1-41]|uniref:TRAP transporter small permease n=1 Tax=Halomonas sp. AOP27-A1-41 TaxID=3457707 RepID=UPI0040332632